MAVATSVEGLQKALPNSQEFQIAEILYCDRRPSSDKRFDPESNSEYLHRPHLIKAVEFEHEGEVRIVTCCQKGTPGVMVKGIKSKELIQEIVSSPLLPYTEATAIEASLRKALPKVRIRQSSLRGDEPLDFQEFIEEHALVLQPFCDDSLLPPILAKL